MIATTGDIVKAASYSRHVPTRRLYFVKIASCTQQKGFVTTAFTPAEVKMLRYYEKQRESIRSFPWTQMLACKWCFCIGKPNEASRCEGSIFTILKSKLIVVSVRSACLYRTAWFLVQEFQICFRFQTLISTQVRNHLSLENRDCLFCGKRLCIEDHSPLLYSYSVQRSTLSNQGVCTTNELKQFWYV